MGDVRLAQVFSGSHPVRIAREFNAAAADGVDAWVIHTWRDGAVEAQRAGCLEQATASADDHRVAGAQALRRTVDECAHAFGNHLVLQIAAANAGVATRA